MATFLVTFGGTDRRIPFEPKIKTLEALLQEVGSTFGLPAGQFRLTYKDVENDEIEIVDPLDFDYFVSLGKETELNVTVVSDAKPLADPPQPSFKKDKDAPEPVIPQEIGNEAAPQTNSAQNPDRLMALEEEFLDALNNEADQLTAAKNLKTLNDCLSDAEVLTDLKRKVEAIRAAMEVSLADMKTELVRAKRKNSGVVSREIDSTYVHRQVICANCGLNPINGKRFKCVTCRIELCEVCEENNFHSQHPMIRLVESERPAPYYDELAQLVHVSMGNLRSQDLFLKKRLLKGLFGRHAGAESIDAILSSRAKATAEQLLEEFHKLLV